MRGVLVMILLLAIAGKVAARDLSLVSLVGLALLLECVALGLLITGRVRAGCLVAMTVAIGGVWNAWVERQATCQCFGAIIHMGWRMQGIAASVMGLLCAALMWGCSPHRTIRDNQASV